MRLPAISVSAAQSSALAAVSTEPLPRATAPAVTRHALTLKPRTAAVQARTASLAMTPMVALPDAAFADKRIVGEVQGSGLVFKDTLKIEAFDDPKVSGVQLYLSDFERPVTEKLAKGDVFSDPSQGGLTCSKASGKVVVKADASVDKGGEEVFSESRSLLFKSLKVRRIVDKPGETVVYAVYSQRLDKGEDTNNSRFKSALCAVHVDAFE